MADKRTICVVGLGYIGLPTASLLATKGYQVLGVDVKPEVVETINAGRIHIREPELDVLVRSAVQSGRLKAATVPEPADIFILAVPTPFKAHPGRGPGNDQVPDLQFVEAGTRAIAPHLQPGNLVILESTVPVGITEKVAEWLAEERPDLARGRENGEANGCPGLLIAHCPERVLPGQILKELVNNDRIVGGLNEAATEAAAAFYREFVSGEVIPTAARTAEMTKLTENAFRDVNIAFANELSLICDQLGINAWELIRLANHHPRVNILQPGPGVGGHCIAVDPWFIVHSAPEQSSLIRSAREVNRSKPEHIVAKVQELAERLRTPTIACFGLTYKPDIDDLRESPALYIVESLAQKKVGKILAVEPHIQNLPQALYAAGAILVDSKTAYDKADILLGLVAHQALRKTPPGVLQERMVVDVCGMWV